jgi:putative FmdB family regulatory protein
MPLYEYRCQGCGQTFEVIQKFADAPLVLHEGCGGEVERLISPPALRFKGSGWYVNDYGRGGRSTAPSNGKLEPTPAPKTETKTESKAASGAESKPAAKG